MADNTWNGAAWTGDSVPSNTVTAAEAPTNTDAVEEGSNYLICDRSGFRVRVSEGLVDTWDGLKVRRQDWEPRHPQDFVRSVPESSSGSMRPEQTDRFITDEYPNGVTSSDL